MLTAKQKTPLFNRFSSTTEHYLVPVLCSIVLTLILIVETIGFISINQQTISDVQIGFSIAFMAAGALNLHLNTKKNISAYINHGAALLVAIAVISIALFPNWAQHSPLFIYPGLTLLIMVAPYLFKQANENSVWLFNSRFAIAILMSIIASLLFGGGLTAISSSLDFLLGIKIYKDIYKIIWIVAIAFIGPIFGLYLMPKEVNEQFALPGNGSLFERGVMFLINYILTPMLILYIIILHLYAAKILFTFSLPKGQVALMVLTFSLALVAFVLFARPWMSRSTKLTAWFLRYWHLLLCTPLILLAISTSRRIIDYGITPERYMLVALGSWLSVLLIFPLIKRNQLSSTKIISMISGILILASFGPWGAKGISIYSQKSQLVQLLERNDLLAGGKLIKEFKDQLKLSDEDTKTGYSIVQFFRKQNELDALRPLFTAHPEDPFEGVSINKDRWVIQNRINALLEFSHNGKLTQNFKPINFSANKNITINIKDYSTFIPNLSIGSKAGKPIAKRRINETQVWNKDDTIIIDTPNGKWSIKSEKVIEALEKSKKSVKAPLQIKLTSTDGEAKMVITSITGSYRDTRNSFTRIRFNLLIQ